MDNLEGLFHDTLKDILYAEKKILKALPKMARAAESEELKQAFLTHRDQTQQQVDRLQQVFQTIGKRAQGATCEAINGIIAECDELLEDMAEASPIRDAGLVACAQAVEHYEMARYGTLAAWARTMGNADAMGLLETNLEEEQATDKLLSRLSTRGILPQSKRK
jgi:ferritin-like metal-binding protein YciE